MFHSRLFAFSCVALVAMLPLGRCSLAPPPVNGVGGPASDLERGIFEGVNRRRVENGLAHLKWNEAVAREARRHALNMAGRRFFSHVDPQRGDLRARLKESGVRYRRSAENLYQQTGYEDAVGVAVEGWMNSPGHRANIVDSQVTDTGLGTARQADGTVFYVQIFIRPL